MPRSSRCRAGGPVVLLALLAMVWSGLTGCGSPASTAEGHPPAGPPAPPYPLISEDAANWVIGWMDPCKALGGTPPALPTADPPRPGKPFALPSDIPGVRCVATFRSTEYRYHDDSGWQEITVTLDLNPTYPTRARMLSAPDIVGNRRVYTSYLPHEPSEDINVVDDRQCDVDIPISATKAITVNAQQERSGDTFAASCPDMMIVLRTVVGHLNDPGSIAKPGAPPPPGQIGFTAGQHDDMYPVACAGVNYHYSGRTPSSSAPRSPTGAAHGTPTPPSACHYKSGPMSIYPAAA